MADTLIFRGAYLRYMDFRKAEAGWFCRFHMTADYTDAVAEAMGWGDPANGTTSADLEGELVATNAILTPNEKPLQNQERQFDVDTVSDFKFVRVENEDSANEELRFIIRTVMVGAAGMMEDYARHIGQSASQLRISYAKQEALPFTDQAQQEKQQPKSAEEGEHACVACETGVKLAEGTLIHANGEPCVARQEATAPESDGPVLLSAREMGTGTHAAKGKKRAGQGRVIDVVPQPQVN